MEKIKLETLAVEVSEADAEVLKSFRGCGAGNLGKKLGQVDAVCL